MIALDSRVVIAHLSPDDPRHVAASEYLRDEAAEDFLMHSLNLAEVLVGGVRAGRGQEMLDDLQGMGIRVAERPDGEPMRLARLRAGTGLKLPDCCALDTALFAHSALATLDQALAQAARERGIAVAPDRELVEPTGPSR